MCASIPGQIVEVVDPENRLAKVDVSGKERVVNLGLLSEEDIFPGAWVLVQAGLAVARVSEEEAGQMLDLIEELNRIYEEGFS
jgi:hydrogenase expression/formation protein HypC